MGARYEPKPWPPSQDLTPEETKRLGEAAREYPGFFAKNSQLLTPRSMIARIERAKQLRADQMEADRKIESEHGFDPGVKRREADIRERAKMLALGLSHHEVEGFLGTPSEKRNPTAGFVRVYAYSPHSERVWREGHDTFWVLAIGFDAAGKVDQWGWSAPRRTSLGAQ